MAKLDWYDPNRDVAGTELGSSGTNFSGADVKFTTTGIGVTHYFTEKLKALVYYDVVRNEKTALSDYRQDIRDNVLTIRIQMRF
jgi:predicted porin